MLDIDLILPAIARTAGCTTTVPDPVHARLAVYAPPRTVALVFDRE